MDEVAVAGDYDVHVDVRQGRDEAHRIDSHLNVDGVLDQRAVTSSEHVHQLDPESVEIGLVLVHVLESPVGVGVRDQHPAVLVRKAEHGLAVDVLLVHRTNEILEVDQQRDLARGAFGGHRCRPYGRRGAADWRERRSPGLMFGRAREGVCVGRGSAVMSVRLNGRRTGA